MWHIKNANIFNNKMPLKILQKSQFKLFKMSVLNSLLFLYKSKYFFPQFSAILVISSKCRKKILWHKWAQLSGIEFSIHFIVPLSPLVSSCLTKSRRQTGNYRIECPKYGILAFIGTFGGMAQKKKEGLISVKLHWHWHNEN
jgi:hypothetical protein